MALAAGAAEAKTVIAAAELMTAVAAVAGVAEELDVAECGTVLIA